MQTPAAAVTAGQTASSGRAQPHSDVIDLRKVKTYERLPLLQLSFSVLEPGDMLQVVFDIRPTRLEQHLRTYYTKHLVFWSMDAGDEWFTLGIRCLARIANETE